MVFMGLLHSGHDARGPFLVALAHFVNQRHGVLQQLHFAAQGIEQTLLRHRVRGLRLQRLATLPDGLVDDLQVGLHDLGGFRIERP